MPGEAADELDSDGDAFVRIMQARDLQFREIEAFAQHIDTHDEPALETPQRGKVRTAFADRLLAVNDDRAELGEHRAVDLVEVLGALDRLATRHGEMIETGLQIGLEDFAELFGDRQVGIVT